MATDVGDLGFLSGSGVQAERIRSFDWASTPIGSPASWSIPLRTLVSVMLVANQPMFLVWGPERTLIYNDHYRAILGGKHPDALGRDFLRVWYDIDADLRPLVESAYAGVPSYMDDITLMTERNGSLEETHFSYSYNPVADETSRVAGFFCPCIETTQTVLAARAVAESEVRNRQIFDSAVDYAIIATDLEGRVTLWNEGAHHILGWTEQEMLGETAERFFTPEDRAAGRIEIEMRCALETGRGNDERFHLRKSGERFWANGEMTPLRDTAGQAVGFVKVMKDQSERRQLDETLEANRVRLAEAMTELQRLNGSLEVDVAARTVERDRLWDSSPDLLVTMDEHGTYQWINAAWTKLLGWTADELVGRAATDLVHPDDLKATFQALGTARTGTLLNFENRFRRKEGGYRWFSWVAAPIPEGMLATGRHVSDEKEAATTLRRTEDALRQAQKVEAVGQLTGGVAHDFNNLLTVIRGSVDLLRRPNLSDDRRTRYIDAIADTADRAAKLTSQLLSFARRQALTPEVFDAAESVTAVRDMVGTLTGSRIRIEVEIATRPCCINADRNQFDTAIVNMAVNARDAMNGEGVLTIAVKSASGMPAIRNHPAVPGDFIAISIGDTGHGIAADSLEQIFEPFFTTKEVGEGTGLGLSQVFGFAKQSGGEVVVESVEGSGSTFTLYLPQVTRSAPTVVAAVTEAEPMLQSGACILVVEDNTEVGAFATSALAELGYTTILARDAAHALAELQTAEDRFDVVFSDVVMPGMSGVELGQTIRERYPDLPVVLTSGYSNVLAQDASHGFELVHKPYSIDQLADTLRKVIRQHGRRTVMRAPASAQAAL